MSTAVLPAPAVVTPAVPPHVLGYRALKLWQRALDLAAEAYRVAREFPEADQPAVGADFRRAAAAVPASVAVSAQATDRWERQRALQATAAALARTETLAALAERVGALAPADATSFLFLSGDVSRLLRGFVRSTAARMAEAEAEAVRGGGAADAASTASAPSVVARVAEPAPGEPLRVVEAAPAAEPAVAAAVGSEPAVVAEHTAPPSMRAPARAARGGRRRASGGGADG